MPLKNFSLLYTPGLGHNLAPAYDLVATMLVNPGDTEELALTFNGRKKKLKLIDFQIATQRAAVPEKVLTAMLRRFIQVRPAWHRFIDGSFLPLELQQQYHALVERRFAQLGLA